MKTYRPVYLMILITCSCIGAGSSRAEDGQRIFKSADGRSIAGKLLKYNPDGQTATIARSDGREFQVLLKHFSEADQQYIREQSAVKDYMHALRIVSKLRTFDATGGYDDTRYEAGDVQSLGYVITLKNASPTPFKEIEIEYCLFYQQGERHEAEIEYQHGVQYGRRELASMEPGSRRVLKTGKVLIHDTGSICTLFGSDSHDQGGVEGIWLRVAATLPNGERVVRELKSSPLTGDFHNWVTTDIPVGLNKPRFSLAHN